MKDQQHMWSCGERLEAELYPGAIRHRADEAGANAAYKLGAQR
jgi:hypothetical protein